MLLKVRFFGLVFPVLLAGAWPIAAQAATAPGLGAAGSFAVLSAAPLSGGAVTCHNGTITGNVGSSGALAAVVNTCPTTGTTIAPVSAQVVNDFNNAYAAYAAIPCDSNLTGTLASVTLGPGVYCVDAVAKTGTLTLSGPANGVWIFKVAAVPATTPPTGALTGTNFTVVMAPGSNPCNVNWQVAQAATMTDSNFVGTILAGAAITLTRGTFAGNILAKAGVTITGTALVGCAGGVGKVNKGKEKEHCNQGVGNGPEGCDPGNSDNRHTSNDELGGTPGDPGRQGGGHEASAGTETDSHPTTNDTNDVTVEAKVTSAPDTGEAAGAKGDSGDSAHGKSHDKSEGKSK